MCLGHFIGELEDLIPLKVCLLFKVYVFYIYILAGKSSLEENSNDNDIIIQAKDRGDL